MTPIPCQCGFVAKGWRGGAQHRRSCMFAPAVPPRDDRARARYYEWVAQQPQLITLTCIECGEPDSVPRASKGRPDFCSQRCKHIWRRMLPVRRAAMERRGRHGRPST